MQISLMPLNYIVFHLISNSVDSQFCFQKITRKLSITFGSVTGNFFTIALMAGSSALSVKNPGLDLESEHACEQSYLVSMSKFALKP